MLLHEYRYEISAYKTQYQKLSMIKAESLLFYFGYK
jgi:hypothetical protein